MTPDRHAPYRCEDCYKRRKLYWLEMERWARGRYAGWFDGWLCWECAIYWARKLMANQPRQNTMPLRQSGA